MSRGPLLITSFRPWRSHQRSNASHDLIAAMQAAGQLPRDTVWLAQVPVNFQLAPIAVISEIYRVRPRAVICCGMAENRPYLSLEQQAKGASDYRQTHLDLADLLADTWLSEVSYDAGGYVCNWLYYCVLQAIETSAMELPCLFVHVPVLSTYTQRWIQRDLSAVLKKVS